MCSAALLLWTTKSYRYHAGITELQGKMVSAFSTIPFAVKPMMPSSDRISSVPSHITS